MDATAPLAVQRTGLATAVGLTGLATCAAIRAKVANPTQTRFMGRHGDWIMAHQATLEQAWTGRARLARLALLVIDEVLGDLPRAEWASLPLLLCVAETQRPGRLQGLDDRLIVEIQEALGLSFADGSAVVPHGRVSVAMAMAQAGTLMAKGAPQVLIVAVDSLVHGQTLAHYERQGRLLTAVNSNGFIPGEGAGALRIGPAGGPGELVCTGVGVAHEHAALDAGEPLRGDGLSAAINMALDQAGCQMHDMDFRITDLSGEQYYFKEAALALTRTLRRRKHEFQTWHPAENTGEAGALAGAAVLAVADAACRKGYAPGHTVLAHMAADSGRRAAMTLRYRVA